MTEQKTEINGLIRTSTGVLVNKNNNDLIAYKNKKRLLKEKQDEILNLRNQIEEIREILKRNGIS